VLLALLESTVSPLLEPLQLTSLPVITRYRSKPITRQQSVSPATAALEVRLESLTSLALMESTQLRDLRRQAALSLIAQLANTVSRHKRSHVLPVSTAPQTRYSPNLAQLEPSMTRPRLQQQL